MKGTIREEWKQYLFEEGKDYTLEEAIEKAKEAILYLKNKGVRVTENMLFNQEQHEKDFRLSELEIQEYIQKFCKEGYAVKDCTTIVKVMDVIYHMFDIDKNKAYEMALYAANNNLTVTKTIKDKMGVNFDEIDEYMNIVLLEIKNYFLERTLECGKELMEMLFSMKVQHN